MTNEQKIIVEAAAKRFQTLSGIMENISPFEDYSNEIVKCESKKLGTYYEYENCTNNNLISESSLGNLINILKNHDWGIITAYRRGFTKKENILRNRKLRGILNSNKTGVYQLVGHWQEAPDGMEYEEAKKQNLLVDTIERSYLVRRPEHMGIDEFKQMLVDAMTIDGKTQDAIVFHIKGGSYYVIESTGNMNKIGENITFDKVAQAYSEWVRNTSVKFVFEGLEIPSSISGNLMFKTHNILC